MKFRDNCDGCSEDYEFEQGRDIGYICLTNSSANHIIATCPRCGNVTQIFTEPDLFIAIMAELKLSLRIATEPDDATLGLMETLGLIDGPQSSGAPDDSLADYHAAGTSYDLPEPPRDWLYELFNSMRHFGGECGAKCLFPECG